MGSEISELIEDLKIKSHNSLSSILYIVFIILFCGCMAIDNWPFTREIKQCLLGSVGGCCV